MSTLEIILLVATIGSYVLHFIASRTKNTVDDTVADAVDLAIKETKDLTAPK